MIDTSVLVAGLIPDHEFHVIARPHVVLAADGRIPAPVVAEAWAALRRSPWNLSPATVATLLAPWGHAERLAAPSAAGYAAALADAERSGAGAGVHDLVIAHSCAEAGMGLATLDRQQAASARDIDGLTVDLLL
jgi:predicted nucleic acid-binding protein